MIGENIMKEYLEALIVEKCVELDAEIKLEGHFGLTWNDLIAFIEGMPEHWEVIRGNLVKIDFLNGDVFHFLNYLAKGMVEGAL